MSGESGFGDRSVESTDKRRAFDAWRMADSLVLLLYSTVVLWVLPYHEKWADEAQAWLIARDLDLKTIWFHELRYEGSPGLWHTILWVAQHVFHAPYDSIGYIGVAFAIAGAAVLIFFAPFPRYVRWPLAFTYVMVYQYAVIARPYTLLPLLAYAAAICFKDQSHPGRITMVLALLALLTLHGAIIAGCLGLAYFVQFVRSWPEKPLPLKRAFIAWSAVLAFVFLFIALILKPTPDVAEFAIKSPTVRQLLGDLPPQPGVLTKLKSVTCGTFLDYWIPSILAIVFLVIWSFLRKRALEMAFPVLLLIALYAFVHGYPHHHGATFIAAIAGFWIAWPLKNELHSSGNLWLLRSAVLFLGLLSTVNILDAAETIRREIRYPYSGAEDAANYLKSVHADRGSMMGYLFGVVGVQGYFDRNIFANVPAAYWHQGWPPVGWILNGDELRRYDPEYIVIYSTKPQSMMASGVPVVQAQGFELVHFSDGYYLYKQAVYQRETYFIFKKKTGIAVMLPDRTAGTDHGVNK